ncbi:MAG: hypothetical protein ACM3SO_09465 [Betaproteobacteria bacterium]
MAVWHFTGDDPHETVSVTSAVCAPAHEGQPHTVLSCVIKGDTQRAVDCRIALAATLEEAVNRACGQARELARRSQDSGQAVSGVHCSHCPSPREPKCGALARLPRYLGR